MFIQANSRAVSLYKRGDHPAALAEYDSLLHSAKSQNLTHPLLYTVLSNRSACLTELGMNIEALEDLTKAEMLCRNDLTNRDPTSLMKILARKGEALMNTMQTQLALKAYEEILLNDPGNCKARRGLDSAIMLLHQSPQESRRPLTVNAPPLTPKDAEREQKTRDIYNFVRIKTDVLLPACYLKILNSQKSKLESLYENIKAAVFDMKGRGLDPRVMVLGSAFIIPLMALRAGALHVTVVEQWLYLALGCKGVLQANGVDPSSYALINARPSDLTAADIPVPCNILVCSADTIQMHGSHHEKRLAPHIAALLQKFLIKDPTLIPSIDPETDDLQTTPSKTEEYFARAVQDLKAEARVLIVGFAHGLHLSMIAAAEGATVVTLEASESNCREARRTLASRELGHQVTVLQMMGPGNLKPGHIFDGKGANVLAFTDLMDRLPSSRTLANIQSLVRKNSSLLEGAETAQTFPRQLVISVQAIQVSPPPFDGMDLSSLSCYYWSEALSPVDLDRLPHIILSGKTQAFHMDMETDMESEVTATIPCIQGGLMNAFLFFRSDSNVVLVKHLESAALVTNGMSVDVKIDLGSYQISIVSDDVLLSPTPKPHWLQSWGGGSSVENPHVQRAEYCRLILNDFKQRFVGNRGLMKGLVDELALMRRNAESLFLEPICIEKIEEEIMDEMKML